MLLILTTIMAIVYPNIIFLLSALGGVFNVGFIIIFPSKTYTVLFMMKIKEIPVCSLKGIVLLLFGVMFLSAGVTGSILSL